MSDAEIIKKHNLSKVDVDVAGVSNEFGINLLKQLSQDDKDTDVFFSPFSVSMALGMTYNGAQTTTESAMRETLGFGELTKAEINQSYKNLMDYFMGLDSKIQFDIANSIWYRLGFTVEDEFLELNQSNFDAGVFPLDFSLPTAPDEINNWISDNTAGKIPKMIGSIDRGTVMFLINAIYFNGTWTSEFDESNTHNGTFYGKTAEVSCKMMHQENNFSYFGNDKIQAIDLPYGGGACRMAVILPQTSCNLDSLIMVMDSDKWTQWMTSFQTMKGSFSFPKFDVEYKKELNKVLSTMGMGVAFSSGADFRGINKDGGLFISKVDHKAVISVDEKGTEAAAVTVVTVGRGIGGNSEPYFIMTVDRPFLFVIHEQETGAMLFVGKVVNLKS